MEMSLVDSTRGDVKALRHAEMYISVLLERCRTAMRRVVLTRRYSEWKADVHRFHGMLIST
jgi:hypothetical protein